MTTFILTVLGGISIFVSGQFILKLIIDPIQELKSVLGSISYILLANQAKITNAVSDKDISLEVQKKSAEIITKCNMILFYGMVKIIFRLPSKSNILKASRQLNWISYGMQEGVKEFQQSSAYDASKTDFPVENAKAIMKVGELLKIKTTYVN